MLYEATKRLLQSRADDWLADIFAPPAPGTAAVPSDIESAIRNDVAELVDLAATKVADDPTRLSDAEGALDTLLVLLESQPSLTRFSVAEVLKSLCPMFPFC